MKYFPINLDIQDRNCVVVGGGRVAARKIATLLACGGKVRIISPELVPELLELERDGQVEWLPRGFMAGDLGAAFLVIAATDDESVQAEVFSEAEKNNQLINVADVPKRCNFILPAVVERGDLTVSVSTAGKSPALAGKLRQKLEGFVGPEYGVLADIMGILRSEVMKRGESHAENKKLFASLLADDFPEWIKTGDWGKIESHLLAKLGNNISSECLNTLKKVLNCR